MDRIEKLNLLIVELLHKLVSQQSIDAPKPKTPIFFELQVSFSMHSLLISTSLNGMRTVFFC